MSRRRLFDPQVVRESSLCVTVTVESTGGLLYGGAVAVPEPTRRHTRRLVRRRQESLGDLVDWPRAQQQASTEIEQLISAVTTVITDMGFVPTEMAANAAPIQREVGT